MRTFKIVVAAIAVGWLGVPLPVGAEDPPLATISVTGQGEISRAPDLASVAVSIVTNDANAAHALSENNRRYAALTTGLEAIGIAAGDITSTSIQSYFNPRPSQAAAGERYGFVVTRNAQIDVKAFAQTGAVVDAATAAGATQIEGVSYGFRDRRAVERAAQAAAVADAYAQAQALAAAAHVQIVRILRIGNEPGPGRVEPFAMMARKAEAPVPTTITPGDLQVTSSVSITYLIR